MRSAPLSRRDLLVASGSLSVGAALSLLVGRLRAGSGSGVEGSDAALADVPSEQPWGCVSDAGVEAGAAPPDVALTASPTGKLAAAEKEALWSVADGIGAIWNMKHVPKAAFLEIVDMKTEQPPSYLAEYRHAIGSLRASRDKMPVRDFIAATIGAGSAQAADPRIAMFVVGEFARLQLAYGGFRQFGLQRYRGFMGDRSYRRLADRGSKR